MWGPLVLVGTLVIYGWVLGRIRVRVQLAGEKPWWFGYSRDGSNLFALAGVAVGLMGAAFPPPLALLTGFLIVLAVYVIDYWVGMGLRRAISGWLAAACGIGLAGLAMSAPARVVSTLDEILRRLF